jgi:hypothetical protein
MIPTCKGALPVSAVFRVTSSFLRSKIVLRPVPNLLQGGALSVLMAALLSTRPPQGALQVLGDGLAVQQYAEVAGFSIQSQTLPPPHIKELCSEPTRDVAHKAISPSRVPH